jgi:hypothetical protein
MSTLAEAAQVLSNRFPLLLAKDAQSVALLDDQVRQLPFATFFEPVTVTLATKNKRELVIVGPEELTSWTRHIAFGMRCRMRVLEQPIVKHLGAADLLRAMVLLRSHFEAAALAAYTLQELGDAARKGSVDALRELIPKTLFGTALKKHRERPSVAELMKFFEGDTIQICRAVDALDSFYYGPDTDGTLQLVYSLLCEFAHPNHRGVMDFMVASEVSGGWRITYDPNRSAQAAMFGRALETLLVSMRGGYAASELLLCWRFSEEEGSAIWSPPSREEADRVWSNLLQRPEGGLAR